MSDKSQSPLKKEQVLGGGARGTPHWSTCTGSALVCPSIILAKEMKMLEAYKTAWGEGHFSPLTFNMHSHGRNFDRHRTGNTQKTQEVGDCGHEETGLL